MEEKSNSALRRYHLIHPRPSDQQDRTNPADFQRLIPLTMDHLPSSAGLQNKRRRCSITTESSLSTPISSHDPDLIFDRSLPTTTAVATPSGASKRSAQDDTAAYSTPHFLRDQDHYVRRSFELRMDTQRRVSVCCSRTNELAMNIHEVSN